MSTPMAETAPEILVAGDGPVGLMTALSLADDAFETLLLAPNYDQAIDAGDDSRTTAILGNGTALLQELGVWDVVRPDCAPLRRLRIVNDRSPLGLPAADVTFDAGDIGAEHFGWNVPLGSLTRALRAACESRPHLRILKGIKAKAAVADESGYRVALDNGQAVSAALIVAADGRHSVLRDTAGISSDNDDLGQDAIISSFDHARPHHTTSTELHKPGGPFTTVPLPGNRSSLVWVMRREDAEPFATMRSERFHARLNRLASPWLGTVSRIRDPKRWPLRQLLASRLAQRNLVLVGETAHAFSPIGAQGLNLSIRDITTLREIALDAKEATLDQFDAHVGASVAQRYERRRMIDVQTRTRGVGLLNGLVANGSPLSAFLQDTGLRLVGNAPNLRRFAMRALMPPSTSPISLA